MVLVRTKSDTTLCSSVDWYKYLLNSSTVSKMFEQDKVHFCKLDVYLQ